MINKSLNDECHFYIDGKLIPWKTCKECGDDYYTNYKNYYDICFKCAIKKEINK